MPDLIAIRLLPAEPISAEAFAQALEGLTITAFDFSFADLQGEDIGSASYLPLPDPDSPLLLDPETRIVQHVDLVFDPSATPPLQFQLRSVATAVIAVPPGRPEHETSDLRLVISRGAGSIVHQALHYNVAHADGDPDAHLTYRSLPTSLYVRLPPAGEQLQPGDAHVPLPEDGAAPNFTDLLSAVDLVLSAEPGDAPDIDALTPEASAHIAREIASSQDLHAIPVPEGRLEEIYTGPHSTEDDLNTRYLRFDMALTRHQSEFQARARQLTGFVYALSAALAASEMSASASSAALRVPVGPIEGSDYAKQRSLTIGLVLDGGAPDFRVISEVFYALGAGMPVQVTPEQRYQLAIHGSEAELIEQLNQAIGAGSILAPDGDPPRIANLVTVFQAVRRLLALGAADGVTAACPLEADSPARDLVEAWLAFPDEGIDAFWDAALDDQAAGHLDLVLCGVTGGHAPLEQAVRERLSPASAEALSATTAEAWRSLFFDADTEEPDLDLFPPFTQPGTPEQRFNAFLRHLRRIFTITGGVTGQEDQNPGSLPLLDRPDPDPIAGFIAAYDTSAAGDDNFAFGTDHIQAHVDAALQSVFPDDAGARDWLEQAVVRLDELHRLTAGIPFPFPPGIEPAPGPGMRYSVMEALYARGFANREDVSQLSAEDFQAALAGTVAFEHAGAIHTAAGAGGVAPPLPPGEPQFLPVNAEGCLVNCVPLPHRSPFSPIGYLQELLRLAPQSTCEQPSVAIDTSVFLEGVPSGDSIASHLLARCGTPAALLATRSNLETGLPLIDPVNECLERLAAQAPGPFLPSTLNTADDELAGHRLCPLGEMALDADENSPCHDPQTLFEVVPQHSSPAVPVVQPEAYARLAADFSHCILPYSQPLDVSRTYLSTFLGTSRFETLRTFREATSEFVLDSTNPPDDLRSERWREPVTESIAAEYLGINPEELETLFHEEVPEDLLATFYGFTQDDATWLTDVIRLDVFLERTCLTYCQFLVLWQSEYVRFQREPGPNSPNDTEFPDCEPCALADFRIAFIDPPEAEDALRRLIVFIRLWRKLQALPGARYDFHVLRDICNVLGMFNDDGTINPDFIRELYAFQRLRDLLGLPLQDPEDPPTEFDVDARRTQLLQLTTGPDNPTAPKFAWALDAIFDALQPYAQASYSCPPRPPHLLKLLQQNITPLSGLAGFDPDTAGLRWFDRWPHLLRMVEVLGKVYASDFTLPELLFLCSADPQRAGHAPLPQQPDIEAQWRPFDSVPDRPEMSLFALREKLLAVEVTDEDAGAYGWSRIDAVLRTELGYVVDAGQTDFLDRFGNTFVPSLKEAAGQPVAATQRRFTETLADTVPTMAPMWNSPADGPFRYDAEATEIWTELPLKDAAVIDKLSSIRPLGLAEAQALRSVYFAPREVLCHLGFLFPNQQEADLCLIQEEDESRRIAYFQRAFALFYARCRLIAQHLAEHVARVTDTPRDGGEALALRLLRHLRATDNHALAWDTETGVIPPATWAPMPLGGALHALGGLVGTGLGCELVREDGAVAWRDLQGPLDLLPIDGRNAANAPQPLVVPSVATALSPTQDKYLGIRNGFAFNPKTGEKLGGIETYELRLSGFLLVDQGGDYRFSIEVDPEVECQLSWLVQIRQGDHVENLMTKDWPSELGPVRDSSPMRLRRGVWRLEVRVRRTALDPDGPEDLSPQRFGLRLRYRGADTGDELLPIPHQRLYLDRREAFEVVTQDVDNIPVGPQFAVINCYVPTVAVMRATYIQSFKALLCAWRHDLSAAPVTDTDESEIGLFLAHPDAFATESHFPDGPGWGTYTLPFDPNALPYTDNHSDFPNPAFDQRVAPSLRHRQACFQLYVEDLFDYSRVRTQSASAPKAHPARFLQEVHEQHTDEPWHALLNLGVHEDHWPLVSRYADAIQLGAEELFGFPWLVRVWKAELWVRAAMQQLFFKTPTDLRPDLTAALGSPVEVLPGETENGNGNLTRVVRESCFENGEPRRYDDVRAANDGLRLRANAALVAYLCRLERAPLPWGGFAESAGDLSDLLLADATPGLCRKASRIELAISRVQAFFNRARLGLEPGFQATPELLELWERRFASYEVWLACRRREVYAEDWIEWRERRDAQRIEAYRVLEQKLGESVLSVAVQGALDHWPDRHPGPHPGLTPLQASEPAQMRRLAPTRNGLDIHGMPERCARPNWLARLRPERGLQVDNDGDGIPDEPGEETPLSECEHLPLWIQSAIDLGADFIRVDAAGVPLASRSLRATSPDGVHGCCDCGQADGHCIDEYWFWLLPGTEFETRNQDPEWGVGSADDPNDPTSDWDRPDILPGLLHWEPQQTRVLAWCRRHNDEFMPPRHSAEGVRIEGEQDGPRLRYLGRIGDSLTFEVAGAVWPVVGHTETQPAGFRVDLATNIATLLPEVVATEMPTPGDGTFPGDLPAYPYLVHCQPGAPLFPLNMFAPSMAIAGYLRAHCRFEPALRWLECALDPLREDLSVLWCQVRRPPRGIAPASLSGDDLARRRAALLFYVSTLLAWGDAVFRRNTPEAFAMMRNIVQSAARILGPSPRGVIGEDDGEAAPVVALWQADAPPLNPRLLALYETVEDRLAQVRSCTNAHRLRAGRANLDRHYLGNPNSSVDWQALTRSCDAGAPPDPCLDAADGCCPPSPYRFDYLMSKALELAGEVRALSAELQASFEKGDAEYLAAMRERQGEQLAQLARDAGQMRWRASDMRQQALRIGRDRLVDELRHVQALIDAGLSPGEFTYQVLTGVSLASLVAGRVLGFAASTVTLSPDAFTGNVGPLPSAYLKIVGGDKVASSLSFGASIADSLSTTASQGASLSAQNAAWGRRDQEWEHRRDQLELQIDEIDRQIIAAQREQDAALIELDSQERQLQNTREVSEYLRDKLAGHALYLWLVEQLSGLHAQMYELALQTARQAERAFERERSRSERQFIREQGWDNLHEGLLAGERLQLALRRMEKAYRDENQREYELVKHFSLRNDFPLAFLQLRITGRCELGLQEWMYDWDRPGDYFRRIRLVTSSFPCVVGPYTNVNATLTLLSHQTRIAPILMEPPAGCCPGGEPPNGYEAFPDDPRFDRQYAAVESSATSTGQNDAGMHEVNFRPADGRYLYFEYAGAAGSRWRLELPAENNRWDIDTLNDVILHVHYTAREGGPELRAAANTTAQRHLPGDGLRLFDVKRDLSNAWHKLQSSLDDATQENRLELRLGTAKFPYLPGRPPLVVNQILIFFEAPGADPGAHRIVEFFPTPRDVPGEHSTPGCDTISVHCIAAAEWPGLFWGVLSGIDLPVEALGDGSIGSFRFPSEVGEISNLYLTCAWRIDNQAAAGRSYNPRY